MLGVAASERRLRPRGGAAGPDPQGWRPPRRGGEDPDSGRSRFPRGSHPCTVRPWSPAPFRGPAPLLLPSSSVCPPDGALPASLSRHQRIPTWGRVGAHTLRGVPITAPLVGPTPPPALPQPPSSVPPAHGGCGPAPRLAPCRRSIETYRARDGRQFQAIGNLAGKPGT